MRITLLLSLVVLLVVAVDASAQCVKCRFDDRGCAYCGDTTFNAWILCTIINNGYGCRLEGACEGASGDECFFGPGTCVREKEAALRPTELKLERDWQLVAVRISKGHVPPPREKRHS
jgi:hypothetical protein